MQITGLKEQGIVQAAVVEFPGKHMKIGESDLYLPDTEKDSLTIEGIDHPVFASAYYAYEDKLVNGNETRCRIPLTTVLMKKGEYEVIYDSYGKYYVAYKEEEKIHFAPCEDFYELLKPLIHMNEEKNEQTAQFGELRK